MTRGIFESEIQIQEGLPHMIVCICRRITERTVRAAIAEGATTAGDVAAACGAGSGCGMCCEQICEMIAEHRAGERCPRGALRVLSPYLQPAGETA
ncbi:MAG TPA: (2Fe-2S)-binding protein [Haliangiales bacterium]|nr:(2Fe-2S)-binding protein [Haliangiales bacterium]